MSTFSVFPILTVLVDMSTLFLMSDQPNQYRETFDNLCARLHELKERRSELEVELSELNNEINHLDEVTDHLIPLVGPSLIGPGWINGQGITDSIRSVLSESPVGPFTPNEVFKKLQEKGFDFSGHTQPMASIYKILSRLRENGEVIADKAGHKISYTWKISDADIPF
jgi:hypothetical protein